jgi:hypothetical protein
MTLARYVLVVGSVVYLVMNNLLTVEIAWAMIVGVLFPLSTTKEVASALVSGKKKK